MDRATATFRLKEQLRRDVGALYRRDDREWSRPIVETLRQLRETNTRAVIFGGTLRSLLMSRLRSGRFGRPRDIDIVVSGISIEGLRDQFRESVKRETRFGGLQLQRTAWQFDVWPLEQTWALRDQAEGDARFSMLPYTTFFNLEAIAVDVWAPPGQPRTVYSGDDQFFRGLLDRVLEINREENPFPALCVVRALVFASSTGFTIGRRLAEYLVRHAHISDEELTEIQQKHYGRARLEPDVMRRWLDVAAAHVATHSHVPLSFPRREQLTFWPEDEPSMIKFHLLHGSDTAGEPTVGRGRK